MVNIENEYKRLVETGTFAKGLDAKTIGRLIDLYNQNARRKRDENFDKEIHDRNAYFVDLALDTIRQRVNGVKNPKYKSHTILI